MLIKSQNLVCPIDGNRLVVDEKQLRCENGHTFDIARQGYVHLLPVQAKRSKNPGDSKEMIVARTDFLNSGVYQPIANRLTELVVEHYEADSDFCLLDAGCGEGYYLDYVYNRLNTSDNSRAYSFIGLDISKPAIVASAKRNKAIDWLVGTTRQPPIELNSVDIILCMFGFGSLEGFHKLLKPGGILILVEAGENHLNELKEIIYEEARKSKSKNEDADETHGFSKPVTESLQFKSGALDNVQINNLLLMTPHLFRASKEGKIAAANLNVLDVTVDVVFRILQKINDDS